MKVLVINGNPSDKSLCNEMAFQYAEGARSAGNEAELINLYELEFDPILHNGYSAPQELEYDLKKAQELIKWCEHIVIVSPVWWLSTPALLKGFLDRVLLPGFAFKFTGPGKWDKLLKGRSARVIYTLGAPCLASRFLFGDAFWNTIAKGTLGFCGFSPVKRTCFGMVPDLNTEARRQILDEVYQIGLKEKH